MKRKNRRDDAVTSGSYSVQICIPHPIDEAMCPKLPQYSAHASTASPRFLTIDAGRAPVQRAADITVTDPMNGMIGAVDLAEYLSLD